STGTKTRILMLAVRFADGVKTCIRNGIPTKTNVAKRKTRAGEAQLKHATIAKLTEAPKAQDGGTAAGRDG
ncbi:MAG: hypothetical protein IKE30_02105, partial [Clostridia bacterium]|nr:hypothetical protein [Clostridia bacterium]